VALHGNQCKSYSDKDIIPGPKGEKNTNMERALGHHDTERKEAFLMMKAPAAMGKVTTQDSWVPFHIDVVQWMIPQNTMDMSEYLCQYIASSTVVGGAELFWDIVCPETSNIVSKQFDDY